MPYILTKGHLGNKQLGNRLDQTWAKLCNVVIPLSEAYKNIAKSWVFQSWQLMLTSPWMVQDPRAASSWDKPKFQLKLKACGKHWEDAKFHYETFQDIRPYQPWSPARILMKPETHSAGFSLAKHTPIQYTGWCPSVISWFIKLINIINYSYTYHEPWFNFQRTSAILGAPSIYDTMKHHNRAGTTRSGL